MQGGKFASIADDFEAAMTPDEKLLFTTNGVSGDVTVIDMQALKPIKTIKVGRFPWGAAYRP